MFAVICVPDFALQAALRHGPDLRSAAVALVDSAPANISKALLLECTETARAAGVCAGLTAPQAMARCGELVLKSRLPAAEQEAANILLQTAGAFTPHIENTAPGVCTMDLRGLEVGNAECGVRSAELDRSRLTSAAASGDLQQSFGFLPESELRSPTSGGKGRREEEHQLLIEWAEKILAALQRLNLHAQIGIGITPNLALLAARSARPVLVIDCLREFFAALPLEMLQPAPHVRSILQRWGIHTAGAFLALGKDAIAERLGAEALKLFERASADTIRPLDIVAPPDAFEEQMDFEAQIETLEPLLFVLRRFVEQLTTRIALTYRVVAELQLTLRLESGASGQRTFKVPAPTANVETLFRMLHTHLENLRTDAPIISLRLGARPVRSEAQQFGLFESALRDPNHFHETLARLTALLGPDRVGTPVIEATHQPDAFQMKTPDFGEPSRAHAQTPNFNVRSSIFNSSGSCLRRFRPALPADVELKDGCPVFVSTLLMSRAVKRWRGPWRASGAWWEPRRWARQEWDVETGSGEVYRLFQANGDWRVEGVYD